MTGLLKLRLARMDIHGKCQGRPVCQGGQHTRDANLKQLPR